MQVGEGIALMLAARRVHTAVFDVTHATNGLLDVLECSIAEEGKEEKSWEQVQEEGLQHEADALIAQMQAAEGDVEVQRHGMDRLCALAAASSSIHPVLLGQLDVLFNALRSHPDTELIQLAGLNILGRLSSTATAVGAVTERGGIAAALTAISPIPSSALLLENAVSLLRLLASESTNCYLIGRTGGLELVLEGMAAFPSLPSVQEQCVRCVAALLQRDENKQRLMAAGGLDVLAAALQACAGRSVVAAETVVLSVDAMLRWGGGGLVTANMYWALVHTAHAFPWHAAIQQQCGVMLPYFHHLASQPPQPATTPAAVAQPSIAGPPGGATYAPAQSPAGLYPVAMASGSGDGSMERRHEAKQPIIEVKEQLAEGVSYDGEEQVEVGVQQEEDGDEEEEEEEDEEEEEEEEDKEDKEDVDEVKEGELRTPSTASPAVEAEGEVKEAEADAKEAQAADTATEPQLGEVDTGERKQSETSPESVARHMLADEVATQIHEESDAQDRGQPAPTTHQHEAGDVQEARAADAGVVVDVDVKLAEPVALPAAAVAADDVTDPHDRIFMPVEAAVPTAAAAHSAEDD